MSINYYRLILAVISVRRYNERMQSKQHKQAEILPTWFSTQAGQLLLDQQQTALKTLIPDQFYALGLQWGYAYQSTIEGLNIEQLYYADRALSGEPLKNQVVALPEALPFVENSLDIAIMAHTLDYCDNPHHALREIAQALSPEGILVLTGFHPYSLWGLRQRLSKKGPPFDARFISRNKLQDWLALLGFQTVSACMLNYQPPALNTTWRNKLNFMDKMGDRWWPTLGAVHVLVVRKRVLSGLQVNNKQKISAKWFRQLNPTQAKIAHRN